MFVNFRQHIKGEEAIKTLILPPVKPIGRLRHRAYGLKPFIAILKEEGLDALPILTDIGIPLSALDDPDYTMDREKELAFVASALEALDRPGLGLRCGPRYHLSFYGMLGLAAMTSENLAEAFRVVFKYLPMTWTYMYWSLYTENGEAVIELEPHQDIGKCRPYMVERSLAAGYTVGCDALGFTLPLTEVNVALPEPSHAQLYRDTFNCQINFNADSNNFRFSESYLETPLLQTESESARIFAAQCEQICANLVEQGSFSEVIRQHLLQLPNQIASLEKIAERLHMTPRTIQRKLAAEKTSYLELVENVRHNLAAEYLRTTGLTMEEIAVRLGYADAPSFSHAFKRWTGMAPGSMRESNGGRANGRDLRPGPSGAQSA